MDTFLILIGAMVGGIIAIRGGLLAWRADLFLRVYDRITSPATSQSDVRWRANIESFENKVLAGIFVAAGVSCMYLCVRLLMANR